MDYDDEPCIVSMTIVEPTAQDLSSTVKEEVSDESSATLVLQKSNCNIVGWYGHVYIVSHRFCSIYFLFLKLLPKLTLAKAMAVQGPPGEVAGASLPQKQDFSVGHC